MFAYRSTAVFLLYCTTLCFCSVRVARNGRFDPKLKPAMCRGNDSLPRCSCEGYPGAMNVDCSNITTAVILKQLFEADDRQFGYRALDMHGSDIPELTSGILGNVSFYLFNLEDNKFRSVSDDVFKPSKDTANYIRIQNNQLEAFPIPSLDGFLQLSQLNLTNNRLISIAPFPAIPELAVLALGHNQITELNADLFVQLKDLQRLELNNNKLTKVPSRAFVLPDLKEPLSLDLSNNSISEVSKDAFKLQAKFISLAGNQLKELNQDSFQSLIESISSNDGVLDVTGNPMDCSTARWISSNGKYNKTVVGLAC